MSDDIWAGKVHKREAPGETIALCGAGAPWPNSTAFERDDRPATCRSCLKKGDEDCET